MMSKTDVSGENRNVEQLFFLKIISYLGHSREIAQLVQNLSRNTLSARCLGVNANTYILNLIIFFLRWFHSLIEASCQRLCFLNGLSWQTKRISQSNRDIL